MTGGPRVVVLGNLPAAGIDLLRQRFVVEARGHRAESDWLREHAPGAAAIVADPSIQVGPELMDAVGSSLEVVSNFGVGYDNVDVDAARARGVRVTNTPGVLTNATAELAVALMLAAGRRIAEADGMIRREEWTGSAEGILGRELAVRPSSWCSGTARAYDEECDHDLADDPRVRVFIQSCAFANKACAR